MTARASFRLEILFILVLTMLLISGCIDPVDPVEKIKQAPGIKDYRVAKAAGKQGKDAIHKTFEKVHETASSSQLHKAALGGDVNLARMAIESGTDVNIKDYTGQTPLHWAVKGRRYEMVQFLLEQGAEINISDVNGKTPLSIAKEKNDESIADLLEENGGVE